MKIEEGKYYKDRSGNIWGPMVLFDEGSAWPWTVPDQRYTWANEGYHYGPDPTDESPFDLLYEVSGSSKEYDHYYIQGGDLVRIVCTDAPGEHSTIAIDETGKVFTGPPEAFSKEKALSITELVIGRYYRWVNYSSARQPVVARCFSVEADQVLLVDITKPNSTWTLKGESLKVLKNEKFVEVEVEITVK